MSYTLSEFESKQLLSEAGIPVPAERLVSSSREAVIAAEELGFPVAVKLCGRGIAHKTERGLVRLGLADAERVQLEAEDLLGRRLPGETTAQLLVQPMVAGRRELIAGLVRDPQFGQCVMLGLGGVFAEALEDVAFAVAPLRSGDARDLIDSLVHRKVLGPFRGEPEADLEQLAEILDALGRIGIEHPEISSIDVNPLILDGARAIAVDALVELDGDHS